jgi:hypothetical protein
MIHDRRNVRRVNKNSKDIRELQGVTEPAFKRMYKESTLKNTAPSGGISMAFVKTAPGAVTTVDCFLRTDTTGTEITVNCSVIGGSGTEKLNSAVPRLVDGSLIFVQQFGVDWYCTQAFIATDDCKCAQEDDVFNSLAIASDQKFGLDGGIGDTFIRHNSADGEVEHTVEGDKVTTW